MPRVSNVKIEINKWHPRPEQSRDITERVHTLIFQESVLTGETPWHMELVAENIQAEEDLMFDDRRLALRLSLTRDGVEQTSDWRLVTVEESALYYRGSTPILHLTGNSLCSLLKQRQRWRGFVQRTPHFILAQIAAEYGMEAQSVELGRTGVWYQTGENDWDFLKEVARTLLSAVGQKRVWLFLDNRRLQFASIEYSGPTLRRFGVGAGDDRSNQVKFTFHGRRADFFGASQIRTHGFDLAGKRSIVDIPTDSLIPALAGRLGRPYGSGYCQKLTPSQLQEEVRDEAGSLWTELTSKYFAFQTTLVGDVSLRRGSVIEMSAIDPDGRGSALNGKYPIYEIRHVYNTTPRAGVPEGFSTHIGGFRRTSFYGDEVTTGTNLSRAVTLDQYRTQLPEQPDPIVLTVEELP